MLRRNGQRDAAPAEQGGDLPLMVVDVLAVGDARGTRIGYLPASSACEAVPDAGVGDDHVGPPIASYEVGCGTVLAGEPSPAESVSPVCQCTSASGGSMAAAL